MIKRMETPIPEAALVMEEVTDPVELARSSAQRERFARNLAWFEAHALALGEKYRGQCICIAGEELFVADTPEEAFALAKAAHPDDDGRFLHYIQREKTKVANLAGERTPAGSSGR
jgi:hypothetical protein